MKTLISIILFLLCITCSFAETVNAWMAIGVIGGGGTSASPPLTAAYCTGGKTCTATNPGQCDILCEDFEGSTDCDSDNSPDKGAYCRNSWVVAADAGGSSTVFNYTPTGSYCSGTTNLRVFRGVYDGSNAIAATFDTGGAEPITYTQFYFKFESEGIVNANYTTFLNGCVDASCSSPVWRIGLYDNAGSRVLRLIYYNGTTYTSINGSNALTENTWYRIRVKHDYTNTAVEFWLNDDSQGSGSDVGDRSTRYIAIRTPSSAGSLTFQIDNIATDNDTGQGDCQ